MSGAESSGASTFKDNDTFRAYAALLEADGFGLYMEWHISTDGGPRNVACLSIRGPKRETEPLLSAPEAGSVVIRVNRDGTFTMWHGGNLIHKGSIGAAKQLRTLEAKRDAHMISDLAATLNHKETEE